MKAVLISIQPKWCEKITNGEKTIDVRKTCAHCIRYRYHNKTYYKCELWYVSNSEATDIRLKTVACKKYEEESEP